MSDKFSFLKSIEEANRQNMIEQSPVEADTTASEMMLIPESNAIGFHNITQQYPDGKVIFNGFNLSIENKPKGQFVVLMGPSGCGKSTLLRYIAGLQSPTSGEITVFGQPLMGYHPMVFQNYTSFEWMTVLQNVCLPLEIQKVPKRERMEKAMQMIEIVGLQGHENKYAKTPTLSGGQLQRVAIARSLLADPKILLLDEPFGALDVKTRLGMQNFLREMFTDLEDDNIDPTFILVTHDPAEAVYLADDIYIMGGTPASVITHITVPFGSHRTKSIKRSPEFLSMVGQIDDVLA